MVKSFATLVAAASLLFSAAEAHNAFTTLWVNGKSQGDSTCVRTTHKMNAPNTPVVDFTSNDIVCGVNGLEPVAYTCAAPEGATLTFEYRIAPNRAGSGFIDKGHQGPAAVYAKKLSSQKNSGAGDGWFKIWSEGYDAEADLWATEKLIKEDGFLSIVLPPWLPAGDYLFRPEVVAMHNVTPEVEPQFYVGCAQVFLESSVDTQLVIPDEYKVSIPGYIKRGEPSMTYNIYNDEQYSTPKKPYPQSGPKPWAPAESHLTDKIIKQTQGAIPETCLIVNGNWCGVETPAYNNDIEACWKSQDNCWKQGEACWKSQPITGGANCELWSNKCKAQATSCKAGVASGPPAFKFEPATRSVPKFAAPKNIGYVDSPPAVAPSAVSYPTKPPAQVPAAAITPTSTVTVIVTDAPMVSYSPDQYTTFPAALVPTDVLAQEPTADLSVTTTTIVVAQDYMTSIETFSQLPIEIALTKYPAAPTEVAVAPTGHPVAGEYPTQHVPAPAQPSTTAKPTTLKSTTKARTDAAQATAVTVANPSTTDCPYSKKRRSHKKRSSMQKRHVEAEDLEY